MKRVFALIGLLCGIVTFNSFGQTIVPIQLDRPDQTECPFITPKQYIQIENGFNIENINGNQKSYNYPSTLWKYGVNEKFELRLITELVTDKNGTESTTGLLPITIGFKTTLFEEKGVIPKTSFIGHITTANFGSTKFHSSYIAPSFRFTMQHTLTENISLAYNVGAEWNGETAEQTFIYTIATGISLTQKLGMYTELYGFMTKNDIADHRFDCGLTYLINNNFMIDFSGGAGMTANAPNYFLSIGISFRFKTS
jgi:hypothetical protein